ncbi:MAG TPA: ATP-binding protein [Polyangia bacterium]|nr:ATP-binding protein [Polyangia bacterium]
MAAISAARQTVDGMAVLPEIHPKARAIVFTLAAGVLLLVVTGLAFVIERKSQVVDDSVSHSYDVAAALDRSLLLLLDAESMERGYLLTDDARYLQAAKPPFADRFAVSTAHLEGLVSDNPEQKARARALRGSGMDRLRLVDTTIDERLAESESSYGPPLRARIERGRFLTDQVRGLIDEMMHEEERLLARRRQVKARFDHIAIAIILSATGILAGMGVGLVRIQRDLDRRERLEARLVNEKRERERLIRDLERSNRDLDRFAYAASHDLKAPLRGIASLSTWVEEDMGEHLNDTSRKYLLQLRGRVARLEALVDGILSYSRAGQQRSTPERVDVGKLLRNIVELLSPSAKATVEIGAHLPQLTAEPVPMQQVFQNLIDNALKHGQTDHLRVQIDVADSGMFWDFTVKDNGPGIAKEFHERIWGVFQTLESRDKTGGTGIGLATVRKIVESRGGTTWVESSPGAGATFHVAWPKQFIEHYDQPQERA